MNFIFFDFKKCGYFKLHMWLAVVAPAVSIGQPESKLSHPQPFMIGSEW